ncbi:MAG: hypothetical protein M3539_13385 [Acidobacteriota bacterium]|nr:hypothetical protein [Acidobacteriota bacterium]
MRLICSVTILLAACFCAMAQQTATDERRVPLTEAAVALDVTGAPVLEATLSTRALNGAPDSPVTNIRVVIKNVGATPYAYASGLITFYDGAGVRCGEGLFKADAISVSEAFETDTPGIRIRCTPATWRIVATNLLPRIPPNGAPAATALPRTGLNLVISVDGEEHPIQLDKPMVVNLGNAQRTIVVREAP